MAKLQQLLLCGIRSFDPSDSEKVSFGTPLTLFLGQNGCGKTTIIEALKFALTGDLPGGTKQGQGFLNDPQISNKQTTKGCVKLTFSDTRDNQYLVARFMTVTQKAGGGLTFKNDLPSLRLTPFDNPSNKQDITGRCVDINAHIAQALNVSPAILSNVIFCHQENSCWPLDESSKLKEKFDEIFDAVTYNKCVDNIRTFLKNQAQTIKSHKDALKYKENKKTDVEALRQKVEDRKDNVKTLQDQIATKRRELEPIERRINEILELEDKIGALQSNLSRKEEAIKSLKEQQQSIKRNIKEIFKGTDEELQVKLQKFQGDRETIERNIQDMEQRKEDVEKKVKKINSTIQESQVNIGKLNEEKRQFDIKCSERVELVNRAKIKLQLNTAIESDDLNDSDKLLNELKANLEEFQAGFDEILSKTEAEEKRLQDIVAENLVKYSETKQTLESSKNGIKEFNNKLRDIEHKLLSVSSADVQIKKLKKQLENVEADLIREESSVNEAELVRDIAEHTETIRKKEVTLRQVENEYRILEQNYVIEEKIDGEKLAITERENEISNLTYKHLEVFQELFKGDVPESNFKELISEIQNNKTQASRNLSQKVGKMQEEVTTLEATIKHQNESINKCRKELQADQKKVMSLTKGRVFNDVLNESYQKKEKYQKDKGQLASAKIMYEAFINEFENEKPCCPVCQTDFTTRRSMVSEIISQLRAKIKKIPENLGAVERNLKQEENFYNNLQQLKSVNQNIEKLEATVPLLEDELQDKKIQCKKVAEQLNSVKIELTQHQNIVDKCGKIISDAALLDQYMLDIQKYKDNIAEMEREINRESSSRSRNEAQAEMDSLRTGIDASRATCESLVKSKDQYRERCQKLLNTKQRLLEHQSNYNRTAQEKSLYENRKLEYNEKISELKTTIETLTLRLSKCKQELDDSKEQKERTVKDNKRLVDLERKKQGSNSKIIDELEKIQASVNDYLRGGHKQVLINAEEKLAELKSQEEKLMNARNTIIDAISSKKQTLAKEESNLRDLKDNVVLREKQADETKLQGEISELRTRLGSHNYGSLYEERKNLMCSTDEIRRQMSNITGQITEMNKTIKEYEVELSKPENKYAHKEYIKQLCQLRQTELNQTDLWTYTLVLEKSILQFHRERMVNINKIIREYWRNIYRGNDIDYIEIKTELITGRQRRTYDYKVVQVKNGIELEMRGRCSAGQKVLACLVIRMALAETFSTHCGILTLDEPTTNLDRENILSLSETLSRLITSRERERNFQMLIITHDEEFLQTLTRVQSVGHYWRVRRNESGFSVIEKQPL